MILVRLLLLAFVVEGIESSLASFEQSNGSDGPTESSTITFQEVPTPSVLLQQATRRTETDVNHHSSASGIIGTDFYDNSLSLANIIENQKIEQNQTSTLQYTHTTAYTTANEDLLDIINNSLTDGEDSAITVGNSTNLIELNETNLTFKINVEDPIIPIQNKLGYNSSINDNTVSGNLTAEVRFMSFEEWKRHKENLTNETKTSGNNETKKDIGKSNSLKLMNNSKSSLESKSGQSGYSNSTNELDNDELADFKNKFNYASVDCAATIVKTNDKAKGASAILLESKESYLLNKCSESSKFVIIELCQDILVESVVMGNFEFFSSTFKDIKISVSERFPSNNWLILGEFEAKNIRDVQNFKFQNPIIWAKFLKIEFLTHYGDEFYCPISVVRVHGKTMLDEVKEDTISRPETDESQSIVNELLLNTSIGLDDDNIDRCRVILPHLQLADFLQQNPIKNQYCEVTESSHTTISTQESFYKNIMKRLSLLESNATLSLLYIEEQSKLLSQAFTNLEKRQTGNIESLIHSFNSTIIDQLTNFQSSYIHMHNEYAKLFKIQENSHKNLLIESKAKVSSLSRELIFQRGVVVFNSILIFCLLVYVVLLKLAYIEETPSQLLQKYKSISGTYIVGSLKKPMFKRNGRR
jgi:hypothetical protein